MVEIEPDLKNTSSISAKFRKKNKISPIIRKRLCKLFLIAIYIMEFILYPAYMINLKLLLSFKPIAFYDIKK